MITSLEEHIYVVMAIDENEHDQVLAVFKTYESAKAHSIKALGNTGFYDLWIEKHTLLP